MLSHGGLEMVKSILKGIGEFCGFVFVTQRRPKVGFTERFKLS